MREQEDDKDDDIILCPKGCGKLFPLSQMHEHYEECKGKPSTPSNPLVDEILKSVPTWPTTPKAPVDVPPPPKPYVEPEKIIKTEKISPSFCKKCGTEYITDDLFKVCVKCKKIHMRPKMFWWILARYGLMIMWISLLGGFIFGIYSYHKLYP